MTARLVRLLAIYAGALLALCVVIARTYSLGSPERPVVLASVWSAGKLVARAEVASMGARTAEVDRAMAEAASPQLVYETVTGESRMATKPHWLFAISLVPGRDGVMARLNGKTAYVTPDDLLARQAYDHGINHEAIGLAAGADIPLILAMLSERLHASARDIADSAVMRRIRVERTVPSAPRPERITADNMTHAMVREATLDIAHYLARSLDDGGRFRYMVDATENRTLAGYDWPRHAGATYFLAQAAALSGDADLRYATLRAAARLRDKGLVACGDYKCIGQDDIVEVGSSSLAIIAFVEIVRTGIDESYRPLIADLARFLRSQQRADGEFMHQYDRGARRPIDVQFVYFTGEASLALARSYHLSKSTEDRDAARRALAFIVGPAWRFFGNRYYFGEEHWTCQTMADLVESPDDPALDFCVRWQRFGRRMQHQDGDSPQDTDGSLGIDPMITPRLTPVASRCEAAVATLDAATRLGLPEAERRAIDLQTRRALAFLLRHQFRPGPTHLFADPAAVHGAIPGSPVDFQLRIDYAQHAGSAMIRWLAVAPDLSSHP
ncbi:hypothetical protein LZC95_42030 [Pendulispora brunnea]|uniref:Uncharacterized protein n=1 Tax=Pendulispora brunnea TaxID=2905690 RepID=A0ABZ2K4K1_9BACT